MSKAYLRVHSNLEIQINITKPLARNSLCYTSDNKVYLYAPNSPLFKKNSFLNTISVFSPELLEAISLLVGYELTGVIFDPFQLPKDGFFNGSNKSVEEVVFRKPSFIRTIVLQTKSLFECLYLNIINLF